MMMNVWCLVHITCIAVQRALHIPFHSQQPGETLLQPFQTSNQGGGRTGGPKGGWIPGFRIHENTCVLTNAYSRFELFVMLSWDLRTQRGTPDGVLFSISFQKQHTRQVRRPLKGAVSAYEAPYESVTKTKDFLGGTGEQRFPVKVSLSGPLKL